MATLSPSATTLLKQISIFSGLTDQEFAFLTARVVPRKFSARELIFAEAEPCRASFGSKAAS